MSVRHIFKCHWFFLVGMVAFFCVLRAGDFPTVHAQYTQYREPYSPSSPTGAGNGYPFGYPGMPSSPATSPATSAASMSGTSGISSPGATTQNSMFSSSSQPQWVPEQSSPTNQDWKDGFSDSFYEGITYPPVTASANNYGNYGQPRTGSPDVPTVRRGTPQPLNPRYPNYDHWENKMEQPWKWQLLPSGLIYPSYLAGPKEPRMASMWVHQKDFGWVWDCVLGGRAGILRYGSREKVLPEGFQLDIEGAVALRMNLEHDRDMMANDFRFGLPLTFGNKHWQAKFGYYHVSSHMGDEHMITNNDMSSRINYYREALALGISRRLWRDVRIYGETGFAFLTGEETEPWEFQFGIEYAPIYPANCWWGAPFLAVDAHLFQELDFSGYLCVQVGWLWRSESNHIFRIGLQYLNGYDDQYEFHHQNVQKIGFGVWYDF